MPKGKGGTYFVEVAASGASPTATAGEYVLTVKGDRPVGPVAPAAPAAPGAVGGVPGDALAGATVTRPAPRAAQQATQPARAGAARLAVRPPWVEAVGQPTQPEIDLWGVQVG